MCRIRDASLDRHPEIHSTPVREDSSKNCGADQQRLQILDLHFDKFPTSATFACWKIRFKTKVCSCSQFPTEAMLWIKEVEMVESVDDLKFSRSIIGSRGPDFEVLDARIASELNRIIQNTRFKKVSLEQKKKTQKKKTVSFAEDRSLSWSTSISGSLEPMILSRILPTCSLLLFEMMIFRNLIRNGRVFIINDETPAWWHLGRIVQTQNTRVWETQDRIGIVWPGDSSEESWTLLSQTEDNSKKNYRAEFATEFWGQKRKLWDKRRGQESGDKTAWTKKSRRLLAVGVHRAVFPKRQLQVPILFEQVCKINTAESFSEIFCEAECKKMHREPEILEAEAQVREWLDCRAGICTYPFCEKKRHPPECLVYMSESGCRFGEESALMRIARFKNGLANGLQRIVTKVHWPCWKTHDSCVFQKMELPKSSSILRKSSKHTETNPMCSIHQSRGTSRQHSRPESIARTYLPRRTKIRGSVSGGNKVTSAMDPRSSVETGHKCFEINGTKTKQHSSNLRKTGVCLHQLSNLRNENCCRLRSVDAQIQQKGLEWCWNGHFDENV